MISEIRKGKRLSVLFHVILWILALLLPLYFFSAEWISNTSFIHHYYLNAITYGCIFYINYLVLVPRFYFSTKYIVYAISAIGIITLFFLINLVVIRNFFVASEIQREFDTMIQELIARHNMANPPMRFFQAYGYLFTSLLILGFSWGLRVSEKFSQQEKLKVELAKEKLMTELTFLKNQISPHFFFNTLNNIYSLVEINTKNAQDAILRLSKLMRYLLYESDRDKIQIGKEVDFMLNYISLMNLRLSSKVELSINFPEIKSELLIPPLLFIPFIENAYKHGVSYKEKCFINIQLEIAENNLVFECSNSISSEQMIKEKMFSGIGLDNVKKRLELLFQNNFELDIQHTESVYNVKLTINLLTHQA